MYAAPFFELVKAGLWNRQAHLAAFAPVDFHAVYSLACQQQVVGLVAEGLGRVADAKIEMDLLTPFLGDTAKLEQRNRAMNSFIAQLFSLFRHNGVNAVLVKGQGIAQCYRQPLWRACGDIDLLLSPADYQRAKKNLSSKADSIVEEDARRMHVGLVMGPWIVELHGTLNQKFLPRVNAMLAALQRQVMEQNGTRLWNDNGIPVPLPSADTDIIFIFSHILEHFFEHGIGLRQLCDWCRLLHTHGSAISRQLLGERLRAMGLMSEWQAFAAFAVLHLDMPEEEMPFYSDSPKWRRKAGRIRAYVLRYGNFGHNVDWSYLAEAPFLKRKLRSFANTFSESLRQFLIFPVDTIPVWLRRTAEALRKVANKERDL